MTLTQNLTFTVAETVAPTTETSLAELRQLRQQWLDEARSLGYLDQLLVIGREMGQPIVSRHHGTYYLYQHYDANLPNSDVKLIYQEKTGRLVERRGSHALWETLERAKVLLGTCNVSAIDERSGVPADLFAGQQVCQYTKSSHPTSATNKNGVFVPGQWTGSLLSVYNEADDQRQAAIHDQQESERQALLETLLVGVDV